MGRSNISSPMTNSEYLLHYYNLRNADTNTSLGSKLDITDHNVTASSLLSNINTRAFNIDYINLQNSNNCKLIPTHPIIWGLNTVYNGDVEETQRLLTFDSNYTYTKTRTTTLLTDYIKYDTTTLAYYDTTTTTRSNNLAAQLDVSTTVDYDTTTTTINNNLANKLDVSTTGSATIINGDGLHECIVRSYVNSSVGCVIVLKFDITYCK